jgi:rhodanese-related sulfurtransferase
MHMKLVVENDSGRLLGAQIVGERGVDKRIDVLATALSARMKVTDLENLDLAHSPQFSAAKDPVIMAGFAAANVSRSEIKTITCESLRTQLTNAERLQVVDVRTTPEYQAAHIPGSIHIPIDELRDRLAELDLTQDTVVYCRVGFRGYLAARILQQSGFAKVLNLTGGILVCASKDLEAAAPPRVYLTTRTEQCA